MTIHTSQTPMKPSNVDDKDSDICDLVLDQEEPLKPIHPAFPRMILNMRINSIFVAQIVLMIFLATISLVSFQEPDLSLITMVQSVVQIGIKLSSGSRFRCITIIMLFMSLILLALTLQSFYSFDIMMARYHMMIEYALSDDFKNSNNGMLGLGLREYAVRYRFVTIYVLTFVLVNLGNLAVLFKILRYNTLLARYNRAMMGEMNKEPLIDESVGKQEEPGSIV